MSSSAFRPIVLWHTTGAPASTVLHYSCVLPPDMRVDEFRILGLIGEGSMGEVYLAQDTSLGRRVALKLIKHSAMHAGGLERFLDEARATAAFSHPHIVTLHAVGEHDGRPYLALEYIEGESLRARLAGGPLGVREALRVTLAIAEALAEAHGRGVVHSDLKPENVMIPRDGRVRVVDFGLARLVGTTSASSSGTPAYMAPERWRGEPPRAAIDIWALGIMLHELIVAARPIDEREVMQLAYAGAATSCYTAHGTGWSNLVASCLALDGAARPTASELVRRLAALRDPRAAIEDEAHCPFPGLAAFAREDAADYFGRRGELDAVAEVLRTRALVPIVGPSGIGKSSFVYAALIPRLEEVEPWNVCALRPGASPFASLAAAVGQGSEAQLRKQPEVLSLWLGALVAQRGGRVLVFIDQFEEAFTLAPNEARAFCECVARAALADERWRIVLTVRDDFFGRLAEAPAMRAQLSAVIPLAPLSTADLRAAVLGPLANAGYAPDKPELIDRLVRDVEQQPARLPLLQFACRSLWGRRDVAARQVPMAEYDAIGGASGALAAHADEVIVALSREQIRTVRMVLLALVNPDGTRRPQRRAELLAVLPADADGIVERLLEARLIVTGLETADDAQLELAHEALVTAWPQLAHWLDETYEERVLVSDIDRAAQSWLHDGRRDEETWDGGKLARATRRVDEWNITLPTVSREFLAAGVARARRDRRRSRGRVIAIGSVLIAATVVAAIAAVGFERKERQALEQQAEIQLAAADMGRFELVLVIYDWDSVAQRRVPPRTVPPLHWHLAAVDEHDPHRAGRTYSDGSDVRRGASRWDADRRSELVEARSGPAFLFVDDRGGGCGASRVYLQHVPGYADRGPPYRRLEVLVPTCQASTADMVQVPAGTFWRNVSLADAPAGRDELATLPAFAIDRTEVTRGAFAVYEQLSELTGHDIAAPADYLLHGVAAAAALPIAGINYYTAMNYCQYHGKTLPTVDQWQKTFRGGADGNADPRRVTPWTGTRAGRPANLQPAKVNGAPSPVGSYPDDRSPYGAVDLAGNVGEWTSSPADEPRLRTVLGGTWSTSADDHPELISWRNARPDLAMAYDIGVRCAME